MTSTLPPLVQAFSGALGSVTANAIAYPLDLVATRLQTTSSNKLKGLRGILLTLRHILRTEGWSGLYDGLITDTAATLLSNFLYFYFYTFLRAFLVRRKTRLLPPTQSTIKKAVPTLLSVSEELGIGFIAGVASRAISTPLSVITVRLQTGSDDEDEEAQPDIEKDGVKDVGPAKPMGVIGTMKRIYQEEGLQGFWGGFTTTIPLSLNPAITLFLFQIYRTLSSRYAVSHAIQPRSRSQKLATPNARSAFLGAACANSIAIALLYPLILAKTRLQVHRKRSDEQMDMLCIWSKALRIEGIAGLYQGLDAQIAKGFVSQGVTMMIKQRIELLIVALYLRSLRRST